MKLKRTKQSVLVFEPPCIAFWLVCGPIDRCLEVATCFVATALVRGYATLRRCNIYSWADWAAWLPGTCLVGRLVRRPNVEVGQTTYPVNR